MLSPRNIDKLHGKPRAKVWAIALCSGVLLMLSEPPAAVPVVGLVALVPLLIALPRLSAGGAFVATYLVGLIYYGVNIWWLGDMTTDPGSEIYMFLMYVFAANYMASGYAVGGIILRWLLTRRQRWLVWLVPLAWLGHEFAREYHIPAPFPWLSVGYSVVHITPLIQTADIWGVYGLAVIVVLVNAAIAQNFELRGPEARLVVNRDAPYRLSMPIVAAAILVGSCVYGWMRLGQFRARMTDDGPLIGLVQGNLAQEVKVRRDRNRIPASFNEHLALSGQAVQAGAELICWPETMLPAGCTREGLSPWDPEDSARRFPNGVPERALLEETRIGADGIERYTPFVERLRAEIAYEFKTPALIGASTPVPDEEHTAEWKDYESRRHNSAVLFDAAGRLVDIYDKRYIVPGGEYIPLEGNFLIRWIVEGYANELQGFVSHVEPGVRRTLFRLPSAAGSARSRDWAFTSSICYEYAWPGCYIELHEHAEPYPDFHVNISNEGWFKKSSELDQALIYCRYRCIESRVPMVRATNTGITCSIDPTGEVRDVLTVNGKDRLVQGLLVTRPKVLADAEPTIFVAFVKRRIGLVSLTLISVVLILMAIGRFTESRGRRASNRREAELKRHRSATPGSAKHGTAKKRRQRRRRPAREP